MKVYLVDDDSEEAELFQEALQRTDYAIEFVWFDDVMQALEALMKESSMPDVLFLDLNIPQVSGKDLLRLLRANHQTQTLPVVIYSTSISQKDIEDTSGFGVKYYLQKPESFQALCDEVKELLSNES